ncbi:hypothetical protein U1Q18_006681 [Sarracenia purpurea var. burkii]
MGQLSVGRNGMQMRSMFGQTLVLNLKLKQKPVGIAVGCGCRFLCLRPPHRRPESPYDERTYCVYGSDASTAYGLAAFGLLLIRQTVVNGATKYFCFGKGLVVGSSTTCAIFFFVFSWVSGCLGFLIWFVCLLSPDVSVCYFVALHRFRIALIFL